MYLQNRPARLLRRGTNWAGWPYVLADFFIQHVYADYLREIPRSRHRKRLGKGSVDRRFLHRKRFYRFELPCARRVLVLDEAKRSCLSCASATSPPFQRHRVGHRMERCGRRRASRRRPTSLGWRLARYKDLLIHVAVPVRLLHRAVVLSSCTVVSSCPPSVRVLRLCDE